jgi:UDP-N-acetylmuramate--alanine ligase
MPLKMELHRGVKIHFIGIGGVGMSGLAKVLLEKGMSISGSDLNLNAYTEDLRSKGARVFKGHRASHIRDADFVVYSSCIGPRNIELTEAARLKKPVLSRLALFQKFANPYKSIMVTGTHGKTTTSAMLGHIFLNLGLDPTVLLGGDMSPFGNARLGKGEYLVAELDESDGEFVKVKPSLAVITNIENDHLDRFGSFSKLNASFKKFIKNLAADNLIFFSGDKTLRQIQSGKKRKRFSTFGFSSGCEYRAGDVSIGTKSGFNLFYRDNFLGKISLPVSGRHNILNALAAISAALSLGLQFDKIRHALSSFNGVARRFELKGKVKGIKVIEDYAHHPTEIKATLAAARLYNPKRILTIFQPHRYTRTRLLTDEFSLSFSDTDILVVTEVYSAGEKNTFNISARDMIRLIKTRTKKDARFFKTPEEAADFAIKRAGEGDMIFVMGAGDVNRISDKLLEGLRQK